jgi:arylsulfatase A-like enzyme
MHGRSLVPLLRGERVAWRDSLLIEYFSDRVFPWVANMGYQAVRTRRYKYIHYVDLAGMDELYDLDADPYELVNLARTDAGQPALLQLKPELQRLIDASR